VVVIVRGRRGGVKGPANGSFRSPCGAGRRGRFASLDTGRKNTWK
jgi:hypothetical protein